MAMHHPQDDGDQPQFTQSLDKYSSAPPSRWRCTLDTLVPVPTQLLLGHIQVGIALGVAVPLNRVRYPNRPPTSRPPQPVTATEVAVHQSGHGGALGIAPQA